MSDFPADQPIPYKPLGDAKAAAKAALAITAADITDATAAGQALVTGTPEQGRAALEIDAVIPASNDTAGLQAAFTAAGTNGVVSLRAGQTYIVDKLIDVPSGLTLYGNNATLQRSAEVTATTSTAVADQATTIELTSVPSGWGAGTRLTIVTQDGGDNQIATNSSLPLIIASIAGTTVTLEGPVDLPTDGSLDVTGEYPTSSTVVEVFDMIRTSGVKSITCYDLTFDGNRANHGSVKSWRFNRSIISLAPNGDTLIDRCKFINQPCGSMIIGSPFVITNTHYQNNNGGCVHVSNSLATVEPSHRGGFVFANNWAQNICEESDLLDHEEAAVVFSNAVQKGFITNNSLWAGPNTEGMVFGRVSGSSNNEGITVAHNYFHGFRDITDGWNISTNSPQSMYSFFIESNIFDDCGDIVLATSGIGAREVRGLYIRGNQFYGSRINIKSSVTTLIENNQFYPNDREGNLITFPVSSTLIENSKAYIKIRGSFFTIRGNSLYGPQTVQGELTIGIQVRGDTGTSGYRKSASVIIEGNLIEQLVVGIQAFAPSHEIGSIFTNVDCRDNTVVCHTTDAGAIGLVAYPGWQVHGNTVIYWDTSANGILVFGMDANDTQVANTQGPVVTSNTVRTNAADAVSKAFMVGRGVNANDANITFVGNFFGGSTGTPPVFDDNAAASAATITGNIALPIQTETNLKTAYLNYHESL